jgi:hypothetical protein
VNHADPTPGGPAPERAAAPGTGPLSRRLTAFAAALDRAGREYLTGRGVAPAEKYRLRVGACPGHGPGCALVTYGALREHVSWTRVDPAAAAAALLATLLPPGSGP